MTETASDNKDQLKFLRQKRGTIKGQLTKIVAWINTNLPIATAYDCKARLDSICEYKTNFEVVQDQIEAIDLNEFNSKEREEFEQSYIGAKSTLLGAIDDKNDTRGSPLNSTVLNTANNHTLQVEYIPPEDLPGIKMPVFDGDYLQWQQFIDTFEALVHNNPSPHMTDVKRFSRLVSSLKGKAFDTIKHLPVTDANYSVARELLESRFANKRLIFESAIAHLMSMPQAKDTHSLRALYDGVVTQVKALEAIADREDISNGIIIHMVLGKLDAKSKEKWEEQCAGSKKIQKWSGFIKFFEKRCFQLESMDYIKQHSSSASSNFKSSPRSGTSKSYISTNSNACLICRGTCTSLKMCTKFLKMKPKDRYHAVRNKKLCINCFHSDHTVANCTHRNCDKCDKPHNTLLHFEREFKASRSDESSNNNSVALLAATKSTLVKSKSNKFHDFAEEYPLLGTAIVLVKSYDGTMIPVRVLLDSGSQNNYISQRMCHILQLPKLDTYLSVAGIHGESRNLKHAVELTIKSNCTEFEFSITAAVLPKFEEMHPNRVLDISHLTIPPDITLADENYFKPAKIDVIIGVHWSHRLLAPGQRELNIGGPIIQNTMLGWIMVGNINNTNNNTCTKLTFFSAKSENIEELQTDIRRFWELETIVAPHVISSEDAQCEQFFKETVCRKPDGKFVVRIPFKHNLDLLGESYPIAYKMAKIIDRKLQINPEHRKLYDDFMTEYESMGHFEPVSHPVNGYHCYLPYHYVLKPDSTSTKLRVVFNASSPTSTGYSLNQLMHVGPTIQSELIKVLLRFRLHAVAICADISKMYRCIEIDPRDRNLQCILYRKPHEAEYRTYRLTTVTYGTTSAPYLAIRCLHELAITESNLPIGSRAVLNDIYVDDLVSGADNVESAQLLYREVTELLNRGQFPLRKVGSNNETFLRDIPEEWREKYLSIHDDQIIKTLGLIWVPSSDTFKYVYSPHTNNKISKRTILSEISKIFDPLGLITPVTCKGKLFIQHLWQLHINWDAELPQIEHDEWLKFRNQLMVLNELKINRYILSTPLNNIEVELHVFGDASPKAYAACVYVRCISTTGEIKVQLWCAKSRVAPLKIVSLPRLELCAALLCSELLEVVRAELEKKCKVSRSYCYSDSTLTLNWIATSPHNWSTFVANRVTKIQEATTNVTWKHVRSEENPADVASRGQLPKDIVQNRLWFFGPEFLMSSQNEWDSRPTEQLDLDEMPERKQMRFTFTSTVVTDAIQDCKFHNDLSKIKRIFGMLALFINRIRKIPRATYNANNLLQLTANELDAGLMLAVRIVQRTHFADLIRIFSENKKIPTQHPLICLNPFMEDGLLRVGGRLIEANISKDAKFPILLPKNHCLTRAIFDAYHKDNLHVGSQGLLAFVRQRFWPLGGKITANLTVRQCMRCKTIKPVIYKQIMGSLPQSRVNIIDRPFKVTGVDYCGPFYVSHGPRKAKTKAYMVLFICFATKAVHLEVTEELTTEAFLNVLYCFIGRRGIPSVIWSDNAKNFVGAAKELDNLNTLLQSQKHWGEVYEWCNSRSINWRFIPPRSLGRNLGVQYSSGQTINAIRTVNGLLEI